MRRREVLVRARVNGGGVRDDVDVLELTDEAFRAWVVDQILDRHSDPPNTDNVGDEVEYEKRG